MVKNRKNQGIDIMVALSVSKEPLADLFSPTLTEETLPSAQDITGEPLKPSEQFGHFIQQKTQKPNLLDFSPQDSALVTTEGTAEGAPQMALPHTIHPPTQKMTLKESSSTEETEAPILSPQDTSPVASLLVTTPPKDTLPLSKESASTDIETADLFVSDDISTDVLRLAFSLQEQAHQKPTSENLPPFAQNAPGLTRDFPELNNFLAQASFEASRSAAPQAATSALPQNTAILPLDSINTAPLMQNTTEIKGSMTAINPPLPQAETRSLTPPVAHADTRKATLPTPSQTSTAKGNEGAASLTPKALSSLDTPPLDPEQDSELDLEQPEKEMLNTKNKGTSPKETSGKSFSETFSSTAKAEGMHSTDLPSPSLQNADNKTMDAVLNTPQTRSTEPKTPTLSSPQTTQNTPALPTAATEQVAFSIQNNMAKGSREINLQLRPTSLGQVNIKIDINQEGQTFVIVATERQETRDLLQQDARHLSALLEDSGIDVNDDNISYNLFSDQNDKDEQDSSPQRESTPPEESLPSPTLASLNPMAPLGAGEVRIHNDGTWAVVA